MAYEDLFIFGDDELPTSAGMVRRGPYGPRRPLTPEQQAERDAKRAHRDLVEKVRMDTEAEIAEQESAQPTVETEQQRNEGAKKEEKEPKHLKWIGSHIFIRLSSLYSFSSRAG